jgi:hypothetical protein
MQVIRHDALVSRHIKTIGRALHLRRKSRICWKESPGIERVVRQNTLRIRFNSLPCTPIDRKAGLRVGSELSFHGTYTLLFRARPHVCCEFREGF